MNTMPEPARIASFDKQELISCGRGEAKDKHRSFQLDLLRGLAALLVLFSHQVGEPTPGLMQNLHDRLFMFGVTGVDLFFVLSGFLVGGLIFSEWRNTGGINIQRFIIRRGFKIWPAYYAFLLVSLLQALRHHKYSLQEGISKFLPLSIFVQNYLPTSDWNVHTWSVAVEEHFYLALPFLLWFLCRRSSTKAVNLVPVTLLSLILLCNVFRILNFIQNPEYQQLNYTATHVRMDGLLFGVLLSYAYQFQPQLFQKISRRPGLLLLLGISLVSFRFFGGHTHPFTWTVGYTLVYLGYGCCLIAVLNVHRNVGLLGHLVFSMPFRMIAWTGLYSYSIYLWHCEFGGNIMLARVLPYLPNNLSWPIGMPLYMVLVVTIGVVAARIIEIPALAIRERFFPRVSKEFIILSS